MTKQHEITEVLSYSRETGQFLWLEKLHATRVRGRAAGSLDRSGHRRIKLNGRRYFAHHLVWVIEKGWLPKMLDHINGDPDDNRVANLRECTPTQNAINMRRSAANTTGVKGVTRCERGRWRAVIRVNKKLKALGRFDTKEQAAAAYLDAAKKYYQDFARPE